MKTGETSIRNTMTAGRAGRYASALFDLAHEQDRVRKPDRARKQDGARKQDEKGMIETVESSLRLLSGVLAESHELARLVKSPLVSRIEAGKAMAAVAKTLALDDLTTRFLGVLAANRRLGDLANIIAAFGQILAAHRGQMSADVTSAHRLDSEQMTALKARLAANLGRPGGDVTITAHVDPNILGGLVVQLGSRLIDGSIRTRLNHFAQAMKG